MKILLIYMVMALAFAVETNAEWKVTVGKCSFINGIEEIEMRNWMLGMEVKDEVSATMERVAPVNWKEGYKIAGGVLSGLIDKQGFDRKAFETSLELILSENNNNKSLIPIGAYFDKDKGKFVIKCLWCDANEDGFGHVRSWAFDKGGNIIGFITCL